MSASKTDITMQDLLAGAFQAILRGDTGERDRLCAQAEKAFGDRESVPFDEVVSLEPRHVLQRAVHRPEEVPE